MCGRYNFSNEDAQEIYRLALEIQERLHEPIKTGEIYPTNRAAVLVRQEGRELPLPMTWGFPHYKGKGVIINARSETVLDKPMFRQSVMSRRCIVPSTGFFEWGHGENPQQSLFETVQKSSAKTKYLFKRPGEAVLYMAGFFQRFQGADGITTSRFVILTTEANSSMQQIHSRMPVVLLPQERGLWLNDNAGFPALFNRDHIRLAHVPA